MLVEIPALLSDDEVRHCQAVLAASEWRDGTETAGEQARKVKHNLQVPAGAPQARELGEIILQALGRSPLFTSAALPLRVLPPMFNRYDTGMTYGDHVDAAVQAAPGGARLRADVSATLFISPPEAYEGGELVINDAFGCHRVKLAPGSLVLYPASSLHRVDPVTRGSRWASFFWAQSMIRDDAHRELLHNLDLAIMQLREELHDGHPSILALTNTYHNLLRQWAEL